MANEAIRALVEAWLFNLRHQFVTGTNDIALLPPNLHKKYEYVEIEGGGKWKIVNRATQKTLDEEAIQQGLGHWFPRPIEHIDVQPNTPSLFMSVGEWDPLLPACIAAVCVTETRMPLQILNRLVCEKQPLPQIIASIADSEPLLCHLLSSPRWLKNSETLHRAYGPHAFASGLLLRELMKEPSQDHQQFVRTILQTHTNNISPIIALILKLGCISEPICIEIAKQVTVKSADIPNYDAAVQEKMLDRLRKYVAARCSEDIFRYTTSFSPTSNTAFTTAASNECGIHAAVNICADVGTPDQISAVLSSAAFTIALVDLIAPTRNAESIWHDAVRSQPSYRAENINALFAARFAADLDSYKFASTLEDGAMRCINEYACEIPYDNSVPHAIRFESDYNKGAVVFTYAPEFSAFRLHDTRRYVQRYSRWVGTITAAS